MEFKSEHNKLCDRYMCFIQSESNANNPYKSSGAKHNINAPKLLL